MRRCRSFKKEAKEGFLEEMIFEIGLKKKKKKAAFGHWKAKVDTGQEDGKQRTEGRGAHEERDGPVLLVLGWACAKGKRARRGGAGLLSGGESDSTTFAVRSQKLK